MSIRTMAAHPLEATPRSNSYVTIQMRRGLESQMDKSKFLPAEFGATTDTKKLFFAFGAGDVQQLATYQNLEGLMAQALAGLEEEYLGSITQATQNAINATSQASSAATAANQAADEANEIIDAFKEAVDGTVISDSSPSSSTAYSSQKIENDFLKKTGNGSNVTVTFQQVAERAGIQSGDSLAVAFGKLAKFCADIQDYVFSPPVASLASTDAARPLAASMGKRLNDDFTAKFESLNSALDDRTNGKVRIWQDNEGGNIEITSPNGMKWQMDSHNDNDFRLYKNNSGELGPFYTFSGGADKGGNIATETYVQTTLDAEMDNVKVYSDLVGVTFTPDGAGLEYSWGTYYVPEGYCFLNAVIADNSLLRGKYVGIITQRYDESSRTVSLYINWRYSGVWGVLIALAKEKR